MEESKGSTNLQTIMFGRTELVRKGTKRYRRELLCGCIRVSNDDCTTVRSAMDLNLFKAMAHSFLKKVLV